MKKFIMSFLTATLSVMLASCSIIVSYDVSEKEPFKATLSTTSCEINEPDVPKKSEEENRGGYTPEYQLARLPSENYGNSYFTVIVPEKESILFPDEIDYISSSAYKRNKLVEEKYNIKITENKMSSEKLRELSESSELAGSYYADLLVLDSSDVGMFYEKQLVGDFSKKPFFTQEHDFFDSGVNEALNKGRNGIYALYAQTLLDPDDMYCIFYNKSANGAEKLESSGWNRAEFISAAAEYKCITNIKEDIFSAEVVYYQNSEKSAHEAFVQGESLFCLDKIGSIKELSGQMSTLGVLALPLSDREEYSALCALDDMQVFCYPTNPTSDKCTVLVATALGAAGCDENMRAAEEHYHDYVQDNRAANSLKYIFGSFGMPENIVN